MPATIKGHPTRVCWEKSFLCVTSAYSASRRWNWPTNEFTAETPSTQRTRRVFFPTDSKRGWPPDLVPPSHQSPRVRAPGLTPESSVVSLRRDPKSQISFPHTLRQCDRSFPESQEVQTRSLKSLRPVLQGQSLMHESLTSRRHRFPASAHPELALMA